MVIHGEDWIVAGVIIYFETHTFKKLVQICKTRVEMKNIINPITIRGDNFTIIEFKIIINRGCETDLYTAQGFEMLSAGLSGAVNGFWAVADDDQGSGGSSGGEKGSLWKTRRALAKDFWTEPA